MERNESRSRIFAKLSEGPRWQERNALHAEALNDHGSRGVYAPLMGEALAPDPDDAPTPSQIET
eukprot:SM000102S09222  [mRNA]  locus=s102:378400:379113:+ [translate_table: standard]